MIDAPPHPADPREESLADLLLNAARPASDRQLTVAAIVGVAGAIIFWLSLGGWSLSVATAPLTIGAFAAWVLAGRELDRAYAEPGAPRWSVLVIRAFVAVTAVTAVLATLATFGLIFLPLLGRIIS